ncbi:MAG: DUF1080 domain-containing protein [Verrucomicrobiota bacterium]
MKNQLAIFALLLTIPHIDSRAEPLAEGFVSLFNGENLSGWVIPKGDNGHWKVIDGVIDYDALSEAPGDKNLWTERDFKDFTLKIDWKIKETSGLFSMPTVLPDGTYKLDADGKKITKPTPNADSGIFLRGSAKHQVNIWCWDIGSGEVYGIRNDPNTDPEVRAALTPRLKADNPVGEWNTFEITVKGERLTVILNGRTVIENAFLPDVPSSGPLALQHHGGMKDGKYSPASSLVQFRNISIKEL